MAEVQLPWDASVKFVKVICRLGLVASDTEDADRFPDLRSLGGQVTFQIDAKHVRHLPSSEPGRMLVMPGQIYTVQPSTGELVDGYGNVGLYLIDPLSAGIDPRGFTYTATVKPSVGDSWSCTFGGQIQLPDEVDLVRMASILSHPGMSSLDQRVSALEAQDVLTPSRVPILDLGHVSGDVTIDAFRAETYMLTTAGDVALTLSGQGSVAVIITNGGGHAVTYNSQPLAIDTASGAVTRTEWWSEASGWHVRMPDESVVLVRNLDGTLTSGKVVVLTLTADESDVDDIAVYNNLTEVGA